MNTTVSSAKRQVIISFDRPTVLIGERINPTGKKKLAASLLEGDFSIVQKEALAQVKAGADILDVNVGASGVDEVITLPLAVLAVMEVVDVPLCLDSDNPKALEAALKVYNGKAIVNSVNGQEGRLEEILLLVKEYKAAVIGLTQDDRGIPGDVEGRLEVARKIVARAESLGIPREDIIMDSLCLTLGANNKAGLVTLETIRQVREQLGVNQTLGASNISYGLPTRETLNRAFLALAIANGLTCPTVDVAKVRAAVVATDLILGRDNYAMRYIKAYREEEAAKSA